MPSRSTLDAHSESTPSRSAALNARALFNPGEVIDETYEIGEQLGAGGMGEVYEAFDRSLGRRVAIKAHFRHMGDWSVTKEAQALAAINHPSVPVVYRIGKHRGLEYVVMERVYGVTLHAHITQRRATREPFSIAEVLEVLIPLAEGLASVHRAGIAHRDVKPGNVMLAPRNRVVLMDFGIFLPEFAVASETTTPGTAEYMAPETIAGKLAPGDAFLVDVYAFGVLAWELLTGQVPFSATSPFAVFQQHVAAAIPDLEKQRPDAPKRLCALVRSMLAKDPSERPQSLDAVTWQLKALAAVPKNPAAREEQFSVLIVDDDPAIADVLELIVREALPDAVVRVVLDGDRAIDAVRRRAPHVLLLDLQMPGMNGIEVMMYLRGTGIAERTTVLAVSANAQPHDMQLLQLLGINRFVRKGSTLVDDLMPLLREARAMHDGARLSAPESGGSPRRPRIE